MAWNLCAAIIALVGQGIACTFAVAAAQSNDADTLGRELTPVGAIAAGNEEGTIPSWQGGITEPPSIYRPNMHHPDPFADDPLLFTITADNLSEYEDKLSPGQVAMLRRYPDTWRLPVYPSRRSASYPRRIYENTRQNAATSELTPGGNGVVGAAAGFPFPLPQIGLEALWNHLLRYRGVAMQRQSSQVVPTAGGAYTEVRIDERVLYPYFESGASTDTIDNTLAYFMQEVIAPARLAGTILLVHEPLNHQVKARQAWTYNPGQRRVRRAPNVAYDNPGTASDGQRTNDQLDMFNGAPDRYDWTLVGRRELYIPYNSYRLHSDRLRHDDVIQAGHINPDLTRYELHRVWQVEGRLKDGASHVYARRTFFLDEDSWYIVVADHYDNRGEVWRVGEAYTINYYDVPMLWETLSAIYDLQNGRYLASGLNNELPIDDTDVSLGKHEFTPDAMRRRGRR